MPLILAGIDEAGYGPTLGPLCVGLSAFSLAGHEGEGAPDLWRVLESGVGRTPGRGGGTDRRGRVAIADSKQLKLANSVTTTHPLVHLERGVLCFARHAFAALPGACTDADLFDALGVASAWHPCYEHAPTALPVSMTAGELAVSAALVGSALSRAGVVPVALRCDVTPEPAFNATIRTTGNKAEAVLAALGRHLRYLWSEFASDSGNRVGVACDRLGGRSAYGEVLEGLLPGTRAQTLEEGDHRSRYVVHVGEGRRMGVAFLTEGENAHLPVALASMTAKLTRELLMRRFNAYWSERHRALGGVELRPTAGYALDARRWLRDVGESMPDDDREVLVRIA